MQSLTDEECPACGQSTLCTRTLHDSTRARASGLHLGPGRRPPFFVSPSFYGVLCLLTQEPSISRDGSSSRQASPARPVTAPQLSSDPHSRQLRSEDHVHPAVRPFVPSLRYPRDLLSNGTRIPVHPRHTYPPTVYTPYLSLCRPPCNYPWVGCRLPKPVRTTWSLNRLSLPSPLRPLLPSLRPDKAHHADEANCPLNNHHRRTHPRPLCLPPARPKTTRAADSIESSKSDRLLRVERWIFQMS